MRVGFIGLGIMGKPMCRNLIKAGYRPVVYDINREAVEELTADGAIAAGCGAEVAGQSDVVITMVPDSPQVRTVILGQGGVLEGAQEGLTVIDMSSIDPTETRAIGETLSQHGVDMMDAPVSGGEPKALDGTLSIMAGGKKETFDKYEKLLNCMGTSINYVGELGSGNIAKLSNQIVVAGNIAALSEALILAKKSGTDPELVFHAIRGGLAGSTVMEAKGPMMLAQSFQPGFRIELHMKDLRNALNAGHSIHSPLPLTAQIMEVIQALCNDGDEKLDHSAVIKYYEKLAGVLL